MNYRRLYIELMLSALEGNGRPTSKSFTKAGCEVHHIQPQSWGGSDERDNLVILTFKQHFIAHRLLSKLMRSDFPMLAANSTEYAERKEKAMEALREAASTPEAKARSARIALENNWKKAGIPQPPASNKARSETLKAKPDVMCPYCKRSGRGGFLRFHFEHCKDKPKTV